MRRMMAMVAQQADGGEREPDGRARRHEGEDDPAAPARVKAEERAAHWRRSESEEAQSSRELAPIGEELCESKPCGGGELLGNTLEKDKIVIFWSIFWSILGNSGL